MFQKIWISEVIGVFFLFSHAILDVYAEDYSYLQKTLQAIRQYKNETKIPPNDIDFFRLIMQLQIPLSSEERVQVKLELEKLQSPVISKNDLIKLYESKRKVIQSLEQKYRYASQNFDIQGNSTTHDEFVIRQLISNNKICNISVRQQGQVGYRRRNVSAKHCLPFDYPSLGCFK